MSDGSLQYYAECQVTRIRALGAWLRGALPLAPCVAWNAPACDFAFGNEGDRWAAEAGYWIHRATGEGNHGHYVLVRTADDVCVSHFYWEFKEPPKKP